MQIFNGTPAIYDETGCRIFGSRRVTRLTSIPLSWVNTGATALADAIRDVSGKGDIVLDIFGGSGSTLIAAEKTGRCAYLCELDTTYCDRTIARWETYAKDEAEQAARCLNARFEPHSRSVKSSLGAHVALLMPYRRRRTVLPPMVFQIPNCRFSPEMADLKQFLGFCMERLSSGRHMADVFFR